MQHIIFNIEMLLGFSSLSQVDCQVEALDQFCIFDSSDQKFGHLHLQESWVKLANFLLVYLNLHGQK